MDGQMKNYKGRLWLCSHGGHALGLVLRESAHGVMVNRMLLFRQAVDVSLLAKDENGFILFPDAEKKAILEGKADDIECELCDCQRTWEMDQKMVAHLLGPFYGEKAVEHAS